MDLSRNLIKACLCGNSTDFDQYTFHNIPILSCNDCSAIHQDLQISEKQYEDYYKVDYDTKHQAAQRHAHDKEIAKIRFKAYESYVPKSGKLLDVGCNNGAFVDVALEMGYDAYGNELNPDIINARTYAGYLINLRIAPETFNVVTLHDVLEHFVDPVVMLKEINRIMAKDGVLIVDFPHFFVPEGVHHWKHTEHLWILRQPLLEKLLRDTGFKVIKTYEPIASKLVVICNKIQTE